MKLTKRLMTIAEVINNCNVIADIGTDHGYIPIFCVKNKMAKGAIACDVNKGPLCIAEENIKKYKLEDCITTRLSDGLKELKKKEADVIVIAGMGGLLINSILEDGKSVIDIDTRLILQPMIAVKEVRKYLFENGFVITKEKIAKEGNKLYNILETKKTEEKITFDDFDIVVGRYLLENKDELFVPYVSSKIKTLEKIINGIQKSEDKEGLEEYIKELELFKSCLEEKI